jgi:5-methylcytosine-specific restriction endonuclease McrA
MQAIDVSDANDISIEAIPIEDYKEDTIEDSNREVTPVAFADATAMPLTPSLSENDDLSQDDIPTETRVPAPKIIKPVITLPSKKPPTPTPAQEPPSCFQSQEPGQVAPVETEPLPRLVKTTQNIHDYCQENGMSEDDLLRELQQQGLKNKPRKEKPIGDRDNEAQIVIWQLRRATQANAPATLTAEQWLATLDDFSWKCAYCQEQAYACMDHFTPIGLGGGTAKENCVPSCKICNGKKGPLHPDTVLETSMPKATIDRVRLYLVQHKQASGDVTQAKTVPKRKPRTPVSPKPVPTTDELALTERCREVQARIDELRGFKLNKQGSIINERDVIRRHLAPDPAFTDEQIGAIHAYLVANHWQYKKPLDRGRVGAQVIWDEASNVLHILHTEPGESNGRVQHAQAGYKVDYGDMDAILRGKPTYIPIGRA